MPETEAIGSKRGRGFEVDFSQPPAKRTKRDLILSQDLTKNKINSLNLKPIEDFLELLTSIQEKKFSGDISVTCQSLIDTINDMLKAKSYLDDASVLTNYAVLRRALGKMKENNGTPNIDINNFYNKIEVFLNSFLEQLAIFKRSYENVIPHVKVQDVLLSLKDFFEIGRAVQKGLQSISSANLEEFMAKYGLEEQDLILNRESLYQKNRVEEDGFIFIEEERLIFSWMDTLETYRVEKRTVFTDKDNVTDSAIPSEIHYLSKEVNERLLSSPGTPIDSGDKTPPVSPILQSKKNDVLLSSPGTPVDPNDKTPLASPEDRAQVNKSGSTSVIAKKLNSAGQPLARQLFPKGIVEEENDENDQPVSPILENRQEDQGMLRPIPLCQEEKAQGGASRKTENWTSFFASKGDYEEKPKADELSSVSFVSTRKSAFFP